MPSTAAQQSAWVLCFATSESRNVAAAELVDALEAGLVAAAVGLDEELEAGVDEGDAVPLQAVKDSSARVARAIPERRFMSRGY